MFESSGKTWFEILNEVATHPFILWFYSIIDYVFLFVIAVLSLYFFIRLSKTMMDLYDKEQ
jgi:hypothetical protein